IPASGALTQKALPARPYRLPQSGAGVAPASSGTSGRAPWAPAGAAMTAAAAARRVSFILELHAQMLRHGEDVLVAPPAHIEHDVAAPAHLARDLADAGQRMAGLQRGDDPLQLRAQLEGLQRLGVGGGAVLGAAD